MSLQNFVHSVSAAGLLRLGAVALVLVLVQNIVYNLWFHPLASYPGPFWARLSRFPSWWHSYNMDRHVWLRRLQEEYGPGVPLRTSPGCVCVSTPDAFRALTGPKGNNTKAHSYKFFPRGEAYSTIQTIDHREHGRKRRVLANAFSERALRSYEPIVASNMARWIELFEAEIPEGDEWSPSLNVADWLNWLVFDIMGELCFGKSMGMMEGGTKGRGELRRTIHLMTSAMEKLNHLCVSPIASLWIWLKPRGLNWLLEHSVPADIQAWWTWVEEALAERLRKEEKARLGDESQDHKDFFHYLFQERDPVTGELGYSKEEYFEETQLLVTAGADTTAIVLAGVMFYLLRHPDAYARLTEEVLAAFDGAEEGIAPGKRLQSCKYLHAVLNEGLRMTPPVAAELAREILPGGAVIDDKFFPAGVTVSTSPFALGYNEEVFPEPLKFSPERWLVDDKTGVTEESVQQSERALAAFSAGSRGCVGKNLGWMEMNLALANLVYHFEMRRDPNNNLGGGDPVNGRPGRRSPDHYQTYDIFVALRDGPMVQLKKRVHS